MLPEYAIKRQAVIWFLLIAAVVAGLYAYSTSGRLEDPEFTLKTALVITVYPGANAREVQENVTDVVERGIYRLKNIEKLRSYSKPGMSVVYVDLFQSTNSSDLNECWTELRNKLEEIRRDLPPEALAPIVKDDFSQVYGVVFALATDEGISPAMRVEAAKRFQREFSLLPEVGRCELWGEDEDVVEINISKAKLQALNVPPAAVLATLAMQNMSVPAGEMDWQGYVVKFDPTGKFDSLEDIENLDLVGSAANFSSNLVAGLVEQVNPTALESALVDSGLRASGDESLGNVSPPIKLRDVATVRRALADPPSEICRFNGKRCVAIAVAPRPNGNVIKMGEQVKKRADELMDELPLGFNLGVIAYQPDNVTASINLFMKNLKEAVLIVAIVVMVALGWKSGLIITLSLVVTMLATICVMKPMGVVLQRVSLAAFIIALGVLVDNAVVVGDLILVRMERGMKRYDACVDGARRPSKQLLGATIVGALAFLPIFLTPINVGEYCKSLFIVVSVSLLISWFTAMTQTPLFYYLYIKPKKREGSEEKIGASKRIYRALLTATLRHKTLTVVVTCGLCVFAFYEFAHLEQSFFPRAQRAQFMVDCWLPEGSSIHSVENELTGMEKYLLEQEGVESTATFVGGGPPRFYLMYEPTFPNSSYGQIVVNTKTLEDVERLVGSVERELKDSFPEARVRVQKFAMGLPTNHEIEARFNGPDPNVLQRLALETEAIMRESPLVKDVDNNWRQKRLAVVPHYSQAKGRGAGLSRVNLNLSLLCATKGFPVGVYADNMKNIPILVRGAESERGDLANYNNIPVWGLTSSVDSVENLTASNDFAWEDAELFRYDRQQSVIVGCDSDRCNWTTALKAVKPKIESIELPPGYSLHWEGQQAESDRATKQVLSWLPLAGVLMFAILVFLFNDFRQPLIIAATIPLTMIGVSFGMTFMNKPFGFMALLGVMGLLGMQIRNGVVLMDQIDEEIDLAKQEKKSTFDAVVSASLERMRPVVVAATTVIVGMIPLLSDPLFDGMATAMMFGLMFSTLLTLFVVPVLYAISFRVKERPRRRA